MDRAKIANDYHESGYSCAQAVACAFSDVIGMSVEQIAGLLSCFGGGMRTGEICGVITGAALVLGAKWPHAEPSDNISKTRAATKIKQFQRKFKERFGPVRCEELKPLPANLDKSPAAQRLGLEKTCAVYIVGAVEILEEMLEA